MSAVDRIEKLATTLLVDLEAVDYGPYVADGPAAKQQKLQLILDAFEQVGQVAVDHDRGLRTNMLKSLNGNAKKQIETA